jgi:hypothetical protein
LIVGTEPSWSASSNFGEQRGAIAMTGRDCGSSGDASTEQLITFEVVKEPYGWAIRRDNRMMTPVWCKTLAVEQASRMVQALRRHGRPAELRIEDEGVTAQTLSAKLVSERDEPSQAATAR